MQRRSRERRLRYALRGLTLAMPLAVRISRRRLPVLVQGQRFDAAMLASAPGSLTSSIFASPSR